jgi:hypothetical protein
MKKPIPIFIAIAVILCGLSFFGGMQYSQSQRAGGRAQFAGGQFNAADIGGDARTGAARTGMMRGNGTGMVSGEILSADAKSITVKDRTGGSKIVFIGASTEVMKSITGTVADLVVGANVITNGTPNADGSITATTVQLRPAGQTFGGPGGPGSIPAVVPKGQ